MRLTHQRVEILRELCRAADHPSADMLRERLADRLPQLSLDTVYRTLATLEGLGVIARAPVDLPQARFDADASPHHHLACSRCGRVDDLEWDRLPLGPLPREVLAWGEARDVQVVIRGTCRRCLESEQQGPD